MTREEIEKSIELLDTCSHVVVKSDPTVDELTAIYIRLQFIPLCLAKILLHLKDAEYK